MRAAPAATRLRLGSAPWYLPPVGSSYPVGDSVTAAYSSRSATSGGYPVQVPPSQLPPSQLPPSQLPPSQLSPSQLPPSQLPPTSMPPSSQGYPGSSGYPGDHDSGYGTAANYSPPPVPAEQAGYSGYPTAASSGQHAAPPTSEYSYPVGDPGYGLPPASQPVADYSGYQHPVQPDPNGGYQPAAPAPGMGGSHGGFGVDPVQPGYPSAPYNAPYQQTGYPVQGYEADASYPADPYAVDPYGYPGYGSARLPAGVACRARPIRRPLSMSDTTAGRLTPADTVRRSTRHRSMPGTDIPVSRGTPSGGRTYPRTTSSGMASSGASGTGMSTGRMAIADNLG